jgi:hypothetical protein
VSSARQQQLTGFLDSVDLDEPFLDTGHVHRSVKCLELGLLL